MVHFFTKVLASEHIIISLAGIGAAKVPISSMGVQGHPDIFVTRQQDGNMDDNDDDKYDKDDKDKSVVALVVSPKSSQTRIGLNSSSIFGT